MLLYNFESQHTDSIHTTVRRVMLLIYVLAAVAAAAFSIKLFAVPETLSLRPVLVHTVFQHEWQYSSLLLRHRKSGKRSSPKIYGQISV